MSQKQLELVRFKLNSPQKSNIKLTIDNVRAYVCLACSAPHKDRRTNQTLEDQIFTWFEKKKIKSGNVESLHMIYTENQRDKIREVTNCQKVQL